MSTNATIAVTNGVMCKAVYLHWDGYLSWAGVMLHDYYATPEKVEQLISLGALSSIRERLEPAFGEYHTFENPMEDVTIAYHRDRDEPLEIHTFPDLSLMGDKIFIKRLAQIMRAATTRLTQKLMWRQARFTPMASNIATPRETPRTSANCRILSGLCAQTQWHPLGPRKAGSWLAQIAAYSSTVTAAFLSKIRKPACLLSTIRGQSGA